MQSCAKIQKRYFGMEKNLIWGSCLLNRKEFVVQLHSKHKKRGKKNINVCQGKSTTVLARKRNICKLLSWYSNNGEENELEKLLDGLLRRILLPPYTCWFLCFLTPRYGGLMVQQIISDTQVTQKARYGEQNSKWAGLLQFKGNQISSTNIINYHCSFLPEAVKYWKQNSTSFFTQLLSKYRLIQSKKQNKTKHPNQTLNPRLKIKVGRNCKSGCHTSE